MTRFRWARLVLFALLVPLAATTTPAAEGPDRDRAAADEVQRVLELVNDARATPTDCGDEGGFEAAPPLELDHRLSAAAASHSRDMKSRGELSHEGADGSTVADRVEHEGFSWSRLAENIAWGPATVDEVVAGWLASDGHCVNMVESAHEYLGVGRSGDYWTLVLAAPLRAAVH